jgi:hypothetical protein
MTKERSHIRVFTPMFDLWEVLGFCSVILDWGQNVVRRVGFPTRAPVSTYSVASSRQQAFGAR